MEFHVIELTKLPTELKENSSDRLLWAKFINSEQKEEFEMIAKQNFYIGSAYQQLQIISQDEQKRLEYEAREKALRDYNQGILEAEMRGEKRGLKQGIDAMIILLAEMQTPYSDIVDIISKKFNLPQNSAEEYVKNKI